MMRQQLIENSDFSVLLMERLKDGALRVGGEFQLADVENANRRIYPLGLWERVLNDQRTIDRLKNRRMVGELDHPDDGRGRIERAAMVMTKLELNDSKRYPGKKAVYGEYETLPTPHGKILQSLLSAKVGLGVSSRGDGEVEKQGEASVVIPEKFDLDTFDVVLDPSVDVDCKTLGEGAVIASAVSRLMEEKQINDTEFPAYSQILEHIDTSNMPETSRVLVKSVQSMMEDRMGVISAADKLTLDPAVREMVNGLEARLNAALRDTTEQAGRIRTLEQQVNDKNRMLGEKTKELEASAALISEMRIRGRNYKMKAEHFAEHADGDEATGLAERLSAAKKVIGKLVTMNKGLRYEGKLRVAAEALLTEMIRGLEEAKREQYIDNLLVSESEESKEAFRPFLLEVKGGKREISDKLMRLKSIRRENRPTRGARGINEDTRQVARIQPSPSNRILEADEGGGVGGDGRRRMTESEVERHPLREMVNFTRALTRKTNSIM